MPEKYRHAFRILGLLLVIVWALLPQQGAATIDAVSGETGLFLVGVRPGQSHALQTALPAGVEIVRQLPQIGVWLVRVPQGERSALTLSLPASAVRWLEGEGQVRAATEVTPNDNFYLAQQWNLRRLGLPYAWQYARGTAAPVAIVDSGLDLQHGDLAPRLWQNPGEIADNGIDDDNNGYVDDVHGWDFVSNDGLPDDLYYHGSHVAGIVGAASNNGIGVAGVTWDTPLMAVRVLNASGTGTASQLAAGILYAADNGARVLNLSLRLADENGANTVAAAVDYARQRGCLVVAASGNDGGPVSFPARLDKVVAVGASSSVDSVLANSNRGPELDLVAPGENIFSTNHERGYSFAGGTSMATAHVSGVAALLWELEPDWTAEMIRDHLRATAFDLYPEGRDDHSGWGRVDAGAAVARLQPARVFLPYLPYSGPQ